MITIIDYGAGNIKSIANMLSAIGVASRVAATAEDIGSAERLILPGVGHFDHGMANLSERGFVEALNRRVLADRVPLLGICLGAQLLTRGSKEGELPGLGWIDADTVAFDRSRMHRALKVPHMGWADTWQLRQHPLLAPMDEDARYYYVHSFHLACDHPEDAIAEARHGFDFTVGIARGNIAGFQFHPEKSHRFGMGILKAFAGWKPGEPTW